MKKINFTEEHDRRLKELAIDLLFGGTFIKGLAGTEYSVFDILHAVTINTVTTMYSNLKREIEKIESLDEWSMTDYQQRKLADTKKMYEFLNLTIGWRKLQDQNAKIAEKAKELQKELKELELNSLSPEDKIKAKQKELDDLLGVTPVDIEEGAEAKPEASA